MTNDDVIYAYRLRVLASARELGCVAALVAARRERPASTRPENKWSTNRLGGGHRATNHMPVLQGLCANLARPAGFEPAT